MTTRVNRRLFLRALLASGVGIVAAPLIPKAGPVLGPRINPVILPEVSPVIANAFKGGFFPAINRWTTVPDQIYGFSGKTGAMYMLDELVSIREAAKTYPFKKEKL